MTSDRAELIVGLALTIPAAVLAAWFGVAVAVVAYRTREAHQRNRRRNQ